MQPVDFHTNLTLDLTTWRLQILTGVHSRNFPKKKLKAKSWCKQNYIECESNVHVLMKVLKNFTRIFEKFKRKSIRIKIFEARLHSFSSLSEVKILSDVSENRLN